MPQTTNIMKQSKNQETADDSALTAAPCSAMLPMDAAPRCGKWVIVFWHDPLMDSRNYNVRLAQWSKDLKQWKYLNDSDSWMTIREPKGWIPKLQQNKTDMHG
tara:strand:- start:1048 stop:1356 length:309 start_codon:yes stop_codon:yes gene_type:complete